jgi:hypothetical protein
VTAAARALAAAMKPAKPNKYRNRPVVVDGIRFASEREGRRYSELKLMERAGEIANLRLQPRYQLRVGGVLVTTYVGDFSFDERIAEGVWKPVTEDAKGVETDVFKIKRKLLKACLGIDVVLI